LIKEIVYNGHLQSIGAAVVVLISGRILNAEVSIYELGAVYLLFQSVYMFDRLVHLEKDATTNSERVSHLRKYGRWIPTIIIAMALISLVYLFAYSSVYAAFFGSLVIFFGMLSISP